MDNYQAKIVFLNIHQSGQCAISGIELFDSKPDLHHLTHNTKWRRKKFPLFLNSILNLRIVDHIQHLQNGSALKISDMQAEKYEKFLERHPRMSEFVNNPIIEGVEYYE